MKKKLYCMILSLAMAVTMMPAMAFSSYAASSFAAYDVEQLTDAVNYDDSKVTVYLKDDVVVGDGVEYLVPEGKELVLDLNGYTLTLGEDTHFVNNGKLTIKDTDGEGGVTGRGYTGTGAPYGGVVENYGQLVIDGGSYYNNYVQYGGVVCQFAGSTVVEGGSFYGNEAMGFGYGGVFEIQGGSLVINDGYFYDNEAEFGAVIDTYVPGALQENSGNELVIKGGTFEDNLAGDAGGAIYLDADFDLTLSGSPYIYGNSSYINGTLITEADNLYIDCDSYVGQIKLADAYGPRLGQGAKIGIRGYVDDDFVVLDKCNSNEYDHFVTDVPEVGKHLAVNGKMTLYDRLATSTAKALENLQEIAGKNPSEEMQTLLEEALEEVSDNDYIADLLEDYNYYAKELAKLVCDEIGLDGSDDVLALVEQAKLDIDALDDCLDVNLDCPVKKTDKVIDQLKKDVKQQQIKEAKEAALDFAAKTLQEIAQKTKEGIECAVETTIDVVETAIDIETTIIANTVQAAKNAVCKAIKVQLGILAADALGKAAVIAPVVAGKLLVDGIKAGTVIGANTAVALANALAVGTMVKVAKKVTDAVVSATAKAVETAVGITVEAAKVTYEIGSAVASAVKDATAKALVAEKKLVEDVLAAEAAVLNAALIKADAIIKDMITAFINA